MRLASPFADHMVLQRGRANPVWGWDRAGHPIAIRVEGPEATVAETTTTAGTDGIFRASCPELPQGGPYRLVVRGSENLVVEDVAVGEVWLASGQSNMEWKVSLSDGAEREIAEARWPQVRVFTAAQRTAREPQTRVEGSWRRCDSPAVGDVTAVGYYFAREIHQRLGVPVGILDASWGGTRVEAWVSLEALRRVMDVEAELANFAVPTTPPEYLPAALYNGMVAPLVPFGLRGGLFYQGESNVQTHATYRDRFGSLIRDWRRKWGADFPFYFVQLANFVESPEWAQLREAQALTLAEPGTDMAVTIDIGDPADIHPRNKREVGRRLALLALARTYGQTGFEWSGPRFESMAVDEASVVVRFAHADGLRTRGGGDVRGFVLAGEDGAYFAARARIEGKNTVVLTSPAVRAPKTVRYAWADNPDANLENDAGLPGAPFRTDTQ